jgi:hypothetical protein
MPHVKCRKSANGFQIDYLHVLSSTESKRVVSQKIKQAFSLSLVYFQVQTTKKIESSLILLNWRTRKKIIRPPCSFLNVLYTDHVVLPELKKHNGTPPCLVLLTGSTTDREITSRAPSMGLRNGLSLVMLEIWRT